MDGRGKGGTKIPAIPIHIGLCRIYTLVIVAIIFKADNKHGDYFRMLYDSVG